jgi:glycosyltransferase involved in cell wall biosynthesis
VVAISVILPVFNRRAILGRAIDSVLAQDFTDWELIVVDDGSTDGSADVAAAYADHRIRVIRQPGNLGGNAARNRGIEASTAPLVAFLDSDDRFLPHKLRFDVESFAARPDLEVLLTSFLYDKDAPVRKIKSTSPNPPIDDNGQFVEALYLHRLRKAMRSKPRPSMRRTSWARACCSKTSWSLPWETRR